MEKSNINNHSRYRKLAVILAIAVMITMVMFKLGEANSQYLQLAMTPYCGAMVLLGFAYVVDSVLRILAERIPLPKALTRGE